MVTKFLAPFGVTADLRLIPAKNGGWIVEECRYGSPSGDPVGAFSTPDDMIEALSAALCEPTKAA